MHAKYVAANTKRLNVHNHKRARDTRNLHTSKVGQTRVHNEKRRIVNPTAANMRELKWSDELATVAQNYANKCVSGHNPYKSDEAESFKRVGENLYYSKYEATPRKAVEYWDNEKNSYDFGTNICTHEKTCSHYTQKWSAELAIVAQNYANKCTTEHNPYRNQQASFQEVGENLYWNTAQVSPSTAVDSWDNEKNYYNYGSNTCSPSKFCGHYTQKWSAELATVAQNYANKCNATVHNQFRHQQAPSFQTVGENIYMNTAQVSPSTAVNDWDDEKFYYNYGANTCSFVCGHYTQAHNMFRRNVEPTASNMVELQWNDGLAKMADRWARRCQFVHNSRRNNQSMFNFVGENLAYSSDDRKADSYVQMWYAEVKDYTFETNGCSAECSHYTQVVWATTEYIGCGKTYCANLNGFLVVCNYAPAGNYPTQPYRNCQPCSRCPEGYSCSDRLCRPP
ncbi:uncharacterized protein LOC128179829 [Crassostrea angulata]|uniref:uncharacterized protein LOC128179829 n=1 Tax=Magallana angulata TaxID=2784310 RepID=UPI0022B20098|nr:uncharacterized protein LOC128179829 [Crassostrea angulata]